MIDLKNLSSRLDNGCNKNLKAQSVAIWLFLLAVCFAVCPDLALAGASPFTTGATAANTNILAILTPIAVIAVMALGAAAWFNKISWGWATAGVVGICLVFGAQQIVTWVRGMFGV
jgi:type IV secretion system protein VirB2